MRWITIGLCLLLLFIGGCEWHSLCFKETPKVVMTTNGSEKQWHLEGDLLLTKCSVKHLNNTCVFNGTEIKKCGEGYYCQNTQISNEVVPICHKKDY